MVRGKAILGAVTVIMAGFGATIPARAESLSTASANTTTTTTTGFNPFRTGNVETDLDPAKDPGVVVVLDNGGLVNDVAQQDYITGVTGWNFKDFRFRYDNKSDTLAVGINSFGVAGDADGNGDPGSASPETRLRGGVDLPNLGGQEAIAVAFFNNDAANPVLYAGVPADKSQAGPGLNGFNVANPKTQATQGLGFGIERSFGATNATHLGALAFDPSVEHPDFEFTIKNFSKLSGLQRDANGNFKFGFRAYSGNIDDVVAGEDLFKTEIPITVPREQVVPDPAPVPEPTAILAWTLVGGLALCLRSRTRSRSR